MLARLSREPSNPTANTARYLPRTISRLAAGLTSSVSSVPRSFSPAARSSAGWNGNVTANSTSMKAIIRPNTNAPRSCGLTFRVTTRSLTTCLSVNSLAPS